MRIIAYVDGFSVYYACFRGHTKFNNAHLKWLDLKRIFEVMFPDDSIVGVKLFTAIAPSPPDDPEQANRHNTYLRALETVPRTEVHRGRFQKSKRETVLVRPVDGLSRMQTAYVFQEKQSDVSLATHLIVDGFADRFDRAVLFSNDSDFVYPISVTRGFLGKNVMHLSPDREVNRQLMSVASTSQRFDHLLMARCQLPLVITDSHGRTIHKPLRWCLPEERLLLESKMCGT